VLNTGGIFGGGNTGPFIFSLAEQIGEDADGIVDGVSDAVTSLGLGIRQQGQTFKGCMVANANDYSVNGILRVGFNIAGIDAKILSHPVVNAIVGNPVNTILFGTGGETAASGLGMVPGFIQRGIGTATTYGRRTTTLMALNFAARGGVPIALSQASKGAASFFGRFSKELGFGLDFAATLAVNVGITGAEAINCMGVRK
jgi:hypothetical protein